MTQTPPNAPATGAKVLAICPICSGRLQALGSDSVITLSCPAFGWNCASARRVWKRQRLLARLLLLLALAVFLPLQVLHLESRFAAPVAMVSLIFGVFIYAGVLRPLRELPQDPRERTGAP